MTNTHELLIERNKELLNKIEELENGKVEISREAQLKIIDKIQNWKKDNYETGERLKKYEGNTYPSHITNNTTEEWPLWKQLAGHVNFELLLAQYLHTKENPLDELLEMMLNSITRNVVSYYNMNGILEKEREEHKERENKHKGKIERLIKETFPYDKLKENPLKWNKRIVGIERGYLDTINGTDYSDYVISFYKEREKEFNGKIKEVEELKQKVKLLEEREEELEERVDIEVEMNLKALDKSKEYHKKNIFYIQKDKDIIIHSLKLKVQELEKNQKTDRIKQLKNKTKVKVGKKIRKLGERVNIIKEKVNDYVLEKFETHILQLPK